MSDANSNINDVHNTGDDGPAENTHAISDTFLTDITFDRFDLPSSLREGLATAGFDRCTPIQAQTLPLALAGRDIAGQAQTGTGKTAAFLLTIFTRLLQLEPSQRPQPGALIVAPTRELACQIYDEAALLGARTGLILAQVIGGVDYLKQAELLRNGVDIVIGTPGRIIDFIKQGIFKTAHIKLVVVDEADRLLDMGFADDMRFILRKMPHFEKRQAMLFSATLSYRVLDLTYEYMNLPEFISITPKELTVTGVKQTLFHVGLENKLPLLLGLLRREDWQRMMIFVNTKAGVEWLAQKLKGNGYSAEGITGDLTQKLRFKLMEQFKNNQINILVATDVASRGIHVEDVSHVINYDLPQDPENYVHRIGRTARAGKTGHALTLACETYVFHLELLETMLGYKIPVVWPENEWLVADQSAPIRLQRPRPKSRSRIKPPPKGPAAAGPPKKAPAAARPKRDPGYFPGTFFGFSAGPVTPEGTAVTPDAGAYAPNDEPDVANGAETTAVAAEAVTVDATTPLASPPAQARRKKPAKRSRRTTKPVKKDTIPEAEAPGTKASGQTATEEGKQASPDSRTKGRSEAVPEAPAEAPKDAGTETPPKKKRRRRSTRRKPRPAKAKPSPETLSEE